MFDPAFLAGQVFNGLSVGSIYLLAGLGLALSFGLMRVINMAHGEIIMFGGYIAYLTMKLVPGPLALPAAILAAFVAAGALGALLEVGLISRLSSRPLDTLLATWGVSLIAQQAARDIFGATGVSVTAPSWLDGVVAFGGMSLPFTRLFIILIAALETWVLTTTSARRYTLDFGGAVIDTPGVKMFGLWDMTKEKLGEFFPDVAAGTAPPWRRASYERIAGSLS